VEGRDRACYVYLRAAQSPRTATFRHFEARKLRGGNQKRHR
jgi:hypothetical protein